jgi:hypothetical protein
MLVGEGKVASIKRTGNLEPTEGEIEAARSSVTTGTVLRGGVYPYEACRFDFWPLQTTEGQSAVIGLAFDPDERPWAPDAQVRVVSTILALVLDRQRNTVSVEPKRL